MTTFLRYIIQLFLSPGHGWEDLGRENPRSENLSGQGFIPMDIIAAVTVYAGIFYGKVNFGQATICALTIAGSYFLAYYVGKFLFSIYYPKLTGHTPDAERTSNFLLCGLGLMLAFRIIENLLPWNLVALQFLPVYTIFVLGKGSAYLDVPAHKDLRFTLLSAIAVVMVPMLIYYLIFLTVA